MADWSRIVATTIKEYVRDTEVNVLRNRKIPAMLKEKGRITMNHAGDGMQWPLRYKRSPMIGYADTETLTFSRRDRWKTANLDWRGYSLTDSMTKAEKLKNKNTEAIVRIWEQVAKNLMEDAEDQFGDEFYIDGYATGNSRRFHGIESIMGSSGANAGNFIGTPSKSYAGLNTDLGSYGGTWTGTWPIGTGDAHYDFFSPLLVDFTNTGWSAATKTWANTAVEAMRFGIVHSRRNKGQKGMLDFILLNDELYRLFLQIQDVKERLVIDKGKRVGTLASLGFDDVINFDGCDVTFEYGTPASVGYGWNMDYMELKSLQGQLWVPEGPDYDIASKSWRFALDAFGNMSFNPRYFLKLKAYT